MKSEIRFQSRSGLSLIEIMMAVLVMSIGLIGIIAAIPFGAFRMNQMRDADYSVNVARNAFAIIETNQWHIPSRRSWYSNGTRDFDIPFGISNGPTYANFTKPYLLDPVGLSLHGVPSNNDLSPTDLSDYIRITPVFTDFKSPIDKYYTTDTNAPASYIRRSIFKTAAGNNNTFKLDYYFRTSDDILFGLPDNTPEGAVRPEIQRETTSWSNKEGIPLNYGISSFTGEFSWMAMIQPCVSGEHKFWNCPIYPENAVQEAEVDVVVFKGRTEPDPFVFTVIQQGAGRSGGFFQLIHHDSTDSLIDILPETLKNTFYILLVGGDPLKVNTDLGNQYRRFAKWYRVTNFMNSDGEIYITLTGPDCPDVFGWGGIQTGGYPVKAYVFPNVVEVYSKTIGCKTNE